VGVPGSLSCWLMTTLSAHGKIEGRTEGNSRSTILVCDDEGVIRDVIVRYVEHEGMRALQAIDGEQAKEIIRSDPPDLVIVDVMMPKVNGLDLCEWIRSTSDVPVILLTARGEESDRITGLELGADDYVVKPFSPRELIVRVKAILRRTGVRQQKTPLVLDAAGLTIDGRSRQVFGRDGEIVVTATEFDLLFCLASHAHTVFSREQLLAQVWGYEAALDAGTSTVTVHIRRLREKIERDPSRPKIILTIWGVGYRFEA
jgi:DNA-binding response OmpR family regulator